ncbi:hypothetical protein P3491_41675, partial [Vibrio parahaemolyticus]|nr:hypothetical protein [Vibrio parahaemolyticus]
HQSRNTWPSLLNFLSQPWGKNKNTKVRRIIHKLPSTVRDKALIYLANGTDCTISDQGHTQV